MKAIRHMLIAAGTLFVAACQDTSAPAEQITPVASLSQGASTGDYIVVFHNQVDDPAAAARSLTASHGGEIRFIYQNAIRGFAVRGIPAAAAEAIGQNPAVAYVEVDAPVTLFDTQANATWGIDRVDQRDLPLSGSYTYNNNGSGANAYIFDTGIRITHAQFGGRAQYVPNGLNGNFVGDGQTANDCNGHGTHVAGTVGGATHGVAKGVKLWAGRVVDCSGGGNASMLIAALDWCDVNCIRPAVVNMSLGYGDVQSIRDAVKDLSAKGVTSVAAAGNGHWLFGTPQNACLQAPAGEATAITVGATDSNDREASFSNYGTCVDILAPGVSITSAWYTGDNATNTISGTSMATPHVVGAVALYLTEVGDRGPGDVATALRSNATASTITLHSASSSNGTPNYFLYTANFGAGGGGGTNSPPTASFTYSCTGLTCSFNGSGSSDSDGTIATYSWDFGDGSSGSGATPGKTYASSGTRTVTLTVTDNGGATGISSQSVTVAAPSSGITLGASARKVKGVKNVDLTWTGASTTNVDVFRNNAYITTTVNDGAHTDVINTKGGGTYTYRVCEAGTTTCSNNATVTF
jgi:subtilisin family serine protease